MVWFLPGLIVGTLLSLIIILVKDPFESAVIIDIKSDLLKINKKLDQLLNSNKSP